MVSIGFAFVKNEKKIPIYQLVWIWSMTNCILSHAEASSNTVIVNKGMILSNLSDFKSIHKIFKFPRKSDQLSWLFFSPKIYSSSIEITASIKSSTGGKIIVMFINVLKSHAKQMNSNHLMDAQVFWNDIVFFRY